MKTLLGTALLLLLAVPVLAHGGSYKPPPPPIPPVPPPDRTIPGGPITPREPPPLTPGEKRGPLDPGTPAGPLTPNPRPRPRPLPTAPETPTDWRNWWALNSDDILDLRARIRLRRRRSATEALEGRPTAGREERIARLFDEKVLPAMRKIVADPRFDADLRASAILVLAKCGSLRDAHLLFVLAQTGARDDQVVEESAVLGLGILGEAGLESRDVLVGVLDDAKRRWRTRAFAALSLGLLRDRSDVVWEALGRCLRGHESVRDVPICALVAIGLVGDPARIPELATWLARGRIGGNRLSDLERSYVVGALGRIGDEAAMPVVRRELTDKGAYTRRAAMIAMGRLVPVLAAPSRLPWTRLLLKAVEEEHDAMAQSFGWIALGRIAGMVDCPATTRALVAGALVRSLKEGKSIVRPFTALALGLVALDDEADPAKPPEEKARIAEILLAELTKGKGNLSYRSALPLALAMTGDRSASPALIEILEDDGKSPEFRSMAALGLGLLGDPAARRPVLTRLLTEKDGDVRVRCATAAALLGGREAMPLLLEVATSPSSGEFVSGQAALALGPFGDPDSIEPLLGVVEPDHPKGKHAALTRALAVVALGQIGSKHDIRAVFAISRDLDFTAIFAALSEVVTIL